MEQTAQSKNPNEVIIDVYVNQTDLDSVSVKIERLNKLLAETNSLMDELSGKSINLSVNVES